MQRSTKELAPVGSVACGWPKGLGGNSNEKEKKKAKTDMETFLKELEEGFEPAWPSWDEVEKNLLKKQDWAEAAAGVQRNEMGQTKYEFVSA